MRRLRFEKFGDFELIIEPGLNANTKQRLFQDTSRTERVSVVSYRENTYSLTVRCGGPWVMTTNE